MSNFERYFSLYETTDPPPIITDGYRKVYNNYIGELPTVQEQDVNLGESSKSFSFNLDGVLQNSSSSNKLNSSHNIQESSNTIINYFLDKGLTLNQAKGIYGNLMQESGGNINATSRDGHNSYGLAQWTGDRKQKLFSMYGRNPTMKQQLDFLWWELNNSEKSALEALKNTSTIYDATKVFMNKFERPHKNYANFSRRLKYANSIV